MKMDNLSAEQKSNLAFSFHRDIDSTASVKIFVNLRDSSDGAHEFIEASHSSTERSIGDNFLERLYSIKRFEQEFSAQSIYETFVWDGRFSKSSLNNLYPMGSLLQMPTFLVLLGWKTLMGCIEYSLQQHKSLSFINIYWCSPNKSLLAFAI